MLGLYLACCGILLLTYTGQIGEANAYMGMQAWNMSVAGYVGFATGLPVVAWVAARTRDAHLIFPVILRTITVTSFLVLHPVIGPCHRAQFLRELLFCFCLFRGRNTGCDSSRIKNEGPNRSARVESLVVLALLVVVVSAAAKTPASAGFGIDLSYDRRLEGREIYAAGSWLAYGLSMAMNGLTPYLAFRAGLSSRRSLFGVAVAASVSFTGYWA